jgi:hypothetical protein
VYICMCVCMCVPKMLDDVGFVCMEYRHDSCNILGDLRYVCVCVCMYVSAQNVG